MARRARRLGAGRTDGLVCVRLAVGAAALAGIFWAAGAALGGPPPLSPGNILWKTQVGSQLGIWAPAVAHGLVYVSRTGSSEVVALDAQKGDRRWTYTTADPGPMIPTVTDDEVLVTTRSCTIESIAAKTGRRLWIRWLSSYVASSPSVHKGLVYVAGDDRRGTFQLLRLDLRTGSARGGTNVGCDVRGTPVVTDRGTYLTTLDGRLKALEPGRRGKVAWEYPSPVVSMPAVQDDRVFVATLSGTASQVEVLDAAKGTSAPQVAWSSPPPTPEEERPTDGDAAAVAATEADAEAGAEAGAEGAEPPRGRDTTTAPTPRRPETTPPGYNDIDFPGARAAMALTPAIVGGRVYAATAEGGLACTEAGSRRVVWGEAGNAVPRLYLPPGVTLLPLPPAGEPGAARQVQAVRLDAAYWAAPAVAGGRIYVGAIDGELACFDAVTGDKLWSSRLGGSIRSCPAVVGGRVYVTCDDGNVYCLDAGDPAADGWPMWGGGPAHTGNGR